MKEKPHKAKNKKQKIKNIKKQKGKVITMAEIYTLPKTQEELTTLEKERMAVYNELLESRKAQRPLTGRVIQCKPNDKASDSKMRVMAVVNYKGWKILIPIGLMGLDLSSIEEYGREKKESLYKRYIASMLGTDVKFMVYPKKEIDSISSALRMAIGDRSAAMKKEQQDFYLKVNKTSGKSKMERAYEDGIIVKGRVVSTNKSTCFVDVYGKQVQIPKKEMSWRYVANVGDVVRNNDIVNVKITDLAVNHETGEIDMQASLRAAQENVVKNMKLYSEGTITLGVVTGISNGYWIQVGDTETGIDVYCKKINCMELPEVGDTVGVTLFKMDYENGMTFGSVENIVRRANRWGSVAA